MKSKLGMVLMKAADEVGKGIEITGVETSSISEVSASVVNLFISIRNFMLVVGLIAGAVQLAKFIFASGQEKMQHLKTFGFTLIGIVVLILLPSIINFIVSFF